MLVILFFLISILRLISIPLIVVFGELDIYERTRTIVLLILAFLYNNLMGFVAWAFGILIASSMGIFYILIIGIIILFYLIAINFYIRKRVDINNAVYIILVLVAFLSGILFK